MNYYEELGLKPAATAEEIHQAYKRVARLLHPDQHQDEHLRQVAQLQMTRLNEILGTLSDPVLRQRYDASMMAAVVHATPRVLRVERGTMIWASIVVAVLLVFGVVLRSIENERAAPTAATVTPRAPEAAPAHPRASRAVVPQRKIIVRNEDASRPGPQKISHTGPIAVIATTTEVSELSAPSVSVSRAEPQAPRTSQPDPFSFAGTWLYSRVDNTKSLSYPPEYIEMDIKETEAGAVAGRYRGQFKIPDRALSPEVRFHFDGARSTAGTSEFAWEAEDGSRGQLRLRVLSPASLEVSWYTTTFGSERKLASGTAVLYRN